MDCKSIIQTLNLTARPAYPYGGVINGSVQGFGPDGGTSQMTSTVAVLFGIAIMFEAVFSVAGNLVVLWSFKRDPQLRIPRYFYIFNLCLCDLVRGGVIMPIATMDFLRSLPDKYCMYGIYLSYMLFSESVLSIILISSDRCLMVKDSFNYMRNETNGRTGLKIAASWGLSMSWNAVTVLLWKYIEAPACDYGSICTADYERSHYIYLFSIVEFLLPLAIISGLNIATYTGIADAKMIEYKRSTRKRRVVSQPTPIGHVKMSPGAGGGGVLRRFSAGPGQWSSSPRKMQQKASTGVNSRGELFRLEVEDPSVINRELTSTDAAGILDVTESAKQLARGNGGLPAEHKQTRPRNDKRVIKVDSVVRLDQRSNSSNTTTSSVPHSAVRPTSPEKPDDSDLNGNHSSTVTSQTERNRKKSSSATNSQQNLRRVAALNNVVTTTTGQHGVTASSTKLQLPPIATDNRAAVVAQNQHPTAVAQPDDRQALIQPIHLSNYGATDDPRPLPSPKPAQHSGDRKVSPSRCSYQTSLSCNTTQAQTLVIRAQRGASSRRMENLMKSGKTVNFSLRKVGKSLAILVGLYFICWLPTSICIVVNRACDNCIPATLSFFTAFVAYLDPVLNPIIYGLSHKRFAKNFKEICHCGGSPAPVTAY